MAAGVYYVGKHRRGSAKDIVLENDSRVDRDIILNLDIIADDTTGRNDYILAQIAVLADLAVLHDVTEVPNLCPPPYSAGFVYERGFVNKIIVWLFHAFFL
jgi:hypothetical protein